MVCDTKILLSFIKHNKEWVFCGSLLHRIKIKNDYMTTPFKIIKDISKHSEKRDRISVCCPLRETCPNTEVFLVRIFLYSVRIQENTEQKNLHKVTIKNANFFVIIVSCLRTYQRKIFTLNN